MAQITSAEQALKDLVETYLKETPKIDSSLKTLLSISIAKNQTTNEQTNTPLSQQCTPTVDFYVGSFF